MTQLNPPSSGNPFPATVAPPAGVLPRSVDSGGAGGGAYNEL